MEKLWWLFCNSSLDIYIYFAGDVQAPNTELENYWKCDLQLQEKSGADIKTATNSLHTKKASKAKLEEKLKILTAEKHRLVQMLKQVIYFALIYF